LKTASATTPTQATAAIVIRFDVTLMNTHPVCCDLRLSNAFSSLVGHAG
jgi:hypothetical protein